MKKRKKEKDIKKIKKRRKRRLIAFLIFVILIGVGGYYVYNNYIKKPENKIVAKSKVLDSIDKYGYTISDTDTKLYKTKFEELKKVLNEKEIDNKKYSELVAELFIIDFYSLDNKTNKNDVGGAEYVFTNYKANFIDKARDEFYKFVKNNLNDDRNQKLPLVTTINVNSIEKVDTSDYFNNEDLELIDEAYKVDLSWSYDKDLGYSKKATLIVIKDGDIKFSVAKLIGEDK